MPTKLAGCRAALALVAVAALAAPPVAAQRPAPQGTPATSQFTQRAWTLADGLPQGSVFDIAETPDGFLWLATYGGLVRFDGRQFTVIDAATLPSMATSRVQALAPAPNGGLWVAVEGASIFRTDGRQTLETLPPHPRGRRMRDLVVDRQGTLWACLGDLVLHLVDGRWVVFTLPSGRRPPIRTIEIDRAGVAWVGATGGLVRIDGLGVQAVTIDGLGGEDFIAAIDEDDGGRLWVGGQVGLHVSDRSRTRFTRVASLEGSVASVLALDSEAWVSTPAGLTLFSGVSGTEVGTPRLVFPAAALGEVPIRRLRATRSGAVVGGTNDDGIRVLRRQPFTLIGTAEGLADAQVHHVAARGSDGLWVGAACAGLTGLQAGTAAPPVVHRVPSMGLANDCVRGLLTDRRGALWVGQSGGHLTKVRPDGRTRIWSQLDGLPAGDIGPLIEGRDGRVWVGGTAGTVCVIATDDSLRCPAVALDGDPQVVWSLAEDDAGGLWIGQVGRVSRFHGGVMRTWTTRDGIPPYPVRVLRANGDGSVWLGTYGGGLARVRGNRVEVVNSAKGLFDNSISAWVEDGGGGVWLLGNRGVFVGRREDVDAVADDRLAMLTGTVHGPADGMPEGNGGHPAGARLTDGRIAFATIRGLAMFDPRTARGPAVPQVFIEQVHGARWDADAPGQVVVPPGGGGVEIRMSAPYVTAPDDVRIRYRLVGRDDEWVEAGGSRRAPYSGLAPGRYDFLVSARVAASEWSPATRALDVQVLAFWWQTWWARLAALGGLALAGVALVRMRLRGLERRNAALSREIRDRQRAEEASQRHLMALAHVNRLATAGELTASLAHDLGQPLMAVVAHAEASRMLLRAPTPDVDHLHDTLGNIAQEGRRASEVVRGLRRFLGRGSPEFAPVEMHEAMREVTTLLQSTLIAEGVALDVRFPEAEAMVIGDRVPLQQVVMNLVLNAIEALREVPPAQRQLVVRSTPTARGVRVCVADRGPGLSADLVERMFEPFHTTKPGGMGMGLPICRSIVEAHGGRIRARRRCGGGTVLSFFVPNTPPSLE